MKSGEIAGSTVDNSVFVRDFGAIPDDGKSDTKEITKAIEYAYANSKKYVVLDKGIYNLRGDDGKVPTIYVRGVENIKLIGQITNDGSPATILEVNAELANNDELKLSRHLDWENSGNIGVENIIFDLKPRFSTSGKVLMVDHENKRVEVEIFDGMSHFEGMKCFSANAWDLETRKLKHVDALTINMKESYFENLWHRVDRPDKVVYAINNMPFLDKIEVGDGISWHYAAHSSSGYGVYFYNCRNIELDNVHMYNAITVAFRINDSKNVTIRNMHIKPEGNSLATGPRDGIYLSNCRGKLLVDSLYVKGVRWDPLVSRVNFIKIKKLPDDKTIISSYVAQAHAESILQVGDSVYFWCGEKPARRQIKSVEVLQNKSEKEHRIVFTEEIPKEALIDSYISPPQWESAVVMNSVFEDNFGTGLIFESENLILENNLFRNNAYHAVGFGPTSINTGAFVDNIVIRNNHFISNGWINKYTGMYGRIHGGIYGGGITTHEQHPHFSTEPYNRNILIENNIFEDMNFNEEMGAIGIKNAQNVTIRNNTYRNIKNKVLMEMESTKNIVNEDD
ncbi:right-handed parallel beta-helix repeat-containing protein [Proteiniphilum saccharofermentans]|uniref:right-handed parallel beta-helix repeat-containing protein n=1 Tax=Proteiniphilum saccharofermentans TaxID=1642647 RepID=UPI00158744D5|nr:right-handed parallel beta-helix repeat-containing protein [Proteiniphilum saccharofermentans]